MWSSFKWVIKEGFMAMVHIEDKDNAKILKVQGTLSIQDASILRDNLLEALGSSERLLIDLSDVDSIDLACMQVMCSAHRTFFNANKSISITSHISKGVMRSLSSAAIVPEACDRESHGPCLWATGG
jgi:anti-anti-sigma regulatory factor